MTGGSSVKGVLREGFAMVLGDSFGRSKNVGTHNSNTVLLLIKSIIAGIAL